MKMQKMDDIKYMKKALRLAELGRGHTSPNPMVGCVIVKDGKIIGHGYHRCYGEKHAEAAAIDNARESVEGATLYCNLEPCCHTIPGKKTPPCAQRIIKEKIGRVVIATKDPNPYVNGKGIEVLRKHGIQVETGILSEEAALLNERYFKYIQTRMPFVHLKIAQSLDGRIATSNGNSRWITNQTARKIVHQMRATYDAVLVGANTVVKDNPSLTVREVEGRNPYRVVLDDKLIIPDDAMLISDEWRDRTIIFTALEQDHPRVMELQTREIQVITTQKNESGHLDLQPVLKRLAELNIASVLVEGGAEVFTSFIKNKIFDKISLFIAPIIIGSGVDSVGNLGIRSLSEALRLEKVRIKTIDDQVLIEGYRDFQALFKNRGEDKKCLPD